MPTLTEIIPQMRKGHWATRSASKKLGWGVGDYLLIEDGVFVFRSGHPEERSVTSDGDLSPADITYKGWRLVDPVAFCEAKATRLEAQMRPILEKWPNGLFVSWGGEQDIRAWWGITSQTNPPLLLKLDGEHVRIGWTVRDVPDRYSREFKRGGMEWDDCAKALLKDYRFKGAPS